jgi:hypothetical protein
MKISFLLCLYQQGQQGIRNLLPTVNRNSKVQGEGGLGDLPFIQGFVDPTLSIHQINLSLLYYDTSAIGTPEQVQKFI